MAEFDYIHDGDGDAVINLKVVEVNFKTYIISIEVNGALYDVTFMQAKKLLVRDCHVKASGTITVEPDQL